MNTKELKKQVKDLMREKQDLFKQGSLERDKVCAFGFVELSFCL